MENLKHIQKESGKKIQLIPHSKHTACSLQKRITKCCYRNNDCAVEMLRNTQMHLGDKYRLF